MANAIQRFFSRRPRVKPDLRPVTVSEAIGRATFALESTPGATGRDDDLSIFASQALRAETQYSSNPLAHALVDMPSTWLTADGVRLTVPGYEQAQRALDNFWNDPYNDMTVTLPRLIREQALYGEAALAVFRDGGMLRVSRFPTRSISKVLLDPINRDIPVAVIIDIAGGNQDTWRTILPDGLPLSSGAVAARKEAVGDLYLLQRNRLVGNSRGRSDIAPVAAWLDEYDDLLKTIHTHMKYLATFIWDVTCEDESKASTARARIAKSPPKNGSANIHPQGEVWSAITPSVQGAENSEMARIFRNHILTVMQIPEHWLGGGGDINRATASEMGSPAFKALLARQRDWGVFLKNIGGLVLESSGFSKKAQRSVEVEWPSMVAEDREGDAAYVEKLVNTTISARSSNVIDDIETRQVVAVALSRIGVDINVAKTISVNERDGEDPEPEAEEDDDANRPDDQGT